MDGVCWSTNHFPPSAESSCPWTQHTWPNLLKSQSLNFAKEAFTVNLARSAQHHLLVSSCIGDDCVCVEEGGDHRGG